MKMKMKMKMKIWKQEKIKYQFYCFKNLINILWWKLLFLFGVKRSTSPIPEGIYCYSSDIKKNSTTKNPYPYYIIPCKYYKTLGHRYNGCSYLGIITDDMVFGDQCKMCNENINEN
jgi:hypothetical protein